MLLYRASVSKGIETIEVNQIRYGKIWLTNGEVIPTSNWHKTIEQAETALQKRLEKSRQLSEERKQRKAEELPNSQNVMIYKEYLDGNKPQSIATKHGLSLQRVRQIVQKMKRRDDRRKDLRNKNTQSTLGVSKN